jgi:hypothetical protein
MSIWYRKVCKDLSNLPDCIDYYEAEYANAQKTLSLKGMSIERHGSELPGIVEHRFGQLQEIEAILEYLNIELRKKKTAVFRKYLEHYNKALSSRDADKFAEGDVDVVDMALIVNEFALVRNKFLGILKGIDSKGWMIGHIVKLRAAGLDDVSID